MTSIVGPAAPGPLPPEPRPVPAEGRRARARGFRPPGRIDRDALRLWLLTRVAVFMVVSAGAWLLANDREASHPVEYLRRWTQWDTHHYVTIAQWGYDGNPATGPQVPLEAFFPGFPLVLRALHTIGLGYVPAGLLVSFVAGGVATVALARLAAFEAGPGTVAEELASRTVLLFLLAPSAVFLAACYTESLFLGFALPAWLAARRGRWGLAAVLAAGATTTRITGVFLAVALVVEFLTATDGRRRWRCAPWLVLPFMPVVAYFSYLHGRTGDWMAWQHAQEKGWYRDFHWPWEALRTTWHAAFGHVQTTNFAWMFGAELVAVAIGIVLTGWLLWRRRWGEATYMGLQVWAFTTANWFFSVPRATLLWWPLWIGLACWTLRRPALLQAYLVLIAPLMIVGAVAFTNGRWTG